jgi:Putative adhesin
MPTWDFDTPGSVRLDLELPAGRVEIDTMPGDKTHVELEALTIEAEDLIAEARVETVERGATHEVRVLVAQPRGWFISIGRGPEIRLRITCPRDASAYVRTKSADVIARGEFHEVDVKTASGDVNIGEVAADASVKTASGDVSLDTVDGRARVQTASGDVAIQRAGDDVTVQLVSGDLWIRDAAGSVHANTVSGDQRMEAVMEGVIEAHSVSGDVMIGVRRGSRVYVDANTISGSTNSELDLTDAPAGAPEEDEGPLVEVRAKTVSGDVSIVRAAAPAPQAAS